MSIRVPYETVKSTVTQAFLNLGLSQEKAEKCAEIHTESSLEGIESHGLNRVPRFAEYVQKGWVDINAEPELVGAKGAVENYDGHLGIGTLNATFCMDRAVALAKEHGIGCVALKNTTHWMRGNTANAVLFGLDARRFLRLAGCPGRFHRYQLDKHRELHAHVGLQSPWRRQQPVLHRHPA